MYTLDSRHKRMTKIKCTINQPRFTSTKDTKPISKIVLVQSRTENYRCMKMTAKMQITFANKQLETAWPDVIDDIRYNNHC